MSNWTDMEITADARVEVKLDTIRSILDTIVRKAPAVMRTYHPFEAAASMMETDMEVAYRLWFAAQVHTGDTMTMDNRLFTSFTKLVAMADEIGADLDLSPDLDAIFNKLPIPDSDIVQIKLPGNPD
jgi:hypothetical protein